MSSSSSSSSSSSAAKGSQLGFQSPQHPATGAAGSGGNPSTSESLMSFMEGMTERLTRMEERMSEPGYAGRSQASRSLAEMQRQKPKYDWGHEVPKRIQEFTWKPLEPTALSTLLKGVPQFDPAIKVAQVSSSSVLQKVNTPAIRSIISDQSVKLSKVLVQQLRASAGVFNELSTLTPLLLDCVTRISDPDTVAADWALNTGSNEGLSSEAVLQQAVDELVGSTTRLQAVLKLADQALALAFENLAQCTQIFQRDLVTKEVAGSTAARKLGVQPTDRVDSLGPEFAEQLERIHKEEKRLAALSGSGSAPFRRGGRFTTRGFSGRQGRGPSGHPYRGGYSGSRSWGGSYSGGRGGHSGRGGYGGRGGHGNYSSSSSSGSNGSGNGNRGGRSG